VGYSVLILDTTGVNNTAVGSQALDKNTTGASNTVIGYNVASATLATGSNDILIGTSSAVDTAAAGTNYNLNIGNLLQGDMTNSTALGTEALFLQSTSGAWITYKSRTVRVFLQEWRSNVFSSRNGYECQHRYQPKGTGNIVVGAGTGNSILDLSASTNAMVLRWARRGRGPARPRTA